MCAKTQDLAPRIHNLINLANVAGLPLDEDRRKTLATMNLFSLAGRYPEGLPPVPSLPQARTLLKQAGEVFAWLTQKL